MHIMRKRLQNGLEECTNNSSFPMPRKGLPLLSESLTSMLSGDLKERMKSELVHGQIIDIHLKIVNCVLLI